MLDNFLLGNFEDSDLGTGVTVVLARDGATCGVSVRGKAPATRETDLLKSENTVDKVNAVVLSGGSAYGLDACSGVVEFLHKKNLGYNAGKYNVPIVVGASLYDLEYKTFAYPDKEFGLLACETAHEFAEISGSLGAGAGATVGKLFGMNGSSKGGLGVSVIKIGAVEVGAVVAVNAFGNVYKKDSDEFLAGCRVNGQSVNIEEMLKKGVESQSLPNGGNTTLACIVTNARLTKTECNTLADFAHDAYARCIRPVHTVLDGDCIFALSSGEVECNMLSLQAVVCDCLCKAIESAVRK